ncbi:MAG: SprB repeat-containing protein, partial [Parvicellaceae bacterium]
DAPGTIDCFGGTTTIVVSATGGTPPYSGDGTFTVSAGPYSYTVTDANGCTSTISGNITEPTILSSNIVSISDATCGQSNGAFEVTGVDGTAPYQYSDNNGFSFQNSGIFSGLNAGTYNILIQDDNGCQTTINVSIADLSGLTAIVDSQTDVDCFGNATGSVSVTGSGSTAPYTYDIGNGPQATGDFTGLAAGPYSVTVTDANGCTFPVAVTINEPIALTATATGTDPLCNGSTNGSTDVTISGGTAPYTTVWQHGPTAEDLIGVLGTGTYTLDITDDNNCPFTVSITLNDPPAIASSISGTGVSCNGGSDGTATVTASGGTGTLTYNWSPAPGTGQGTASVTGLAPQTYTATITDDNGCFINETFNP